MSCPKSEYSQDFLDGMLNRMAVSYHKYGKVRDSHEDNIASIKLRVGKYMQTGNTEYLIDAANFAMMEFMYPSVEGAFFEATDSSGSPGLLFEGSSRPKKNTNNQGERL